MESRREGEVGRMRGREVEKMRGGGEERTRKRGREVEKRRGGEEKRRGVCQWTVEWLCFLGPAVGDSSTVRSK